MVAKNSEARKCSNTNRASIENNREGNIDMKSVAKLSQNENAIVAPVTFNFHGDHDVRIKVIDGEPWFCLADAASILAIKNVSQLSSQLDNKGISKTYTLTDGGKQQLIFVNEPNLYRVIFRSNKPDAKQFQDWVFNVVLPAIRKTGRYEHPIIRENEFTAKDMRNLTHIIRLMTGNFNYNASWSAGVWYCLRKATGVKSPGKFCASDIPVIADECRRIAGITGLLHRFMFDVETEMIKRVVRHGEDVGPFLEEMRQKFLDVLREEQSGSLALREFEELPINKFQHRIN
ncbi:BRO-N domain-containing protein [Klebsiella huaxiensis]|uniref:Bro-N domain-containing protein n=1 Tax=Klebsiella huaxiensis TaxID=2153354 RepID=A0A564M469_9ENTR|nr:BRO family protein [Klebsiella huaxiensis]VUS88699.1 hypothetical protein SB6422_02761 [Klebsiella huaxiensis]